MEPAAAVDMKRCSRSAQPSFSSSCRGRRKWAEGGKWRLKDVQRWACARVCHQSVHFIVRGANTPVTDRRDSFIQILHLAAHMMELIMASFVHTQKSAARAAGRFVISLRTRGWLTRVHMHARPQTYKYMHAGALFSPYLSLQ